MTSEVMQSGRKSWAETPPETPPLRHVISDFAERQSWLDSLAGPFQNWVLNIFGQPGSPNRKIKDLLNGTWLGHGLHPLLTDIPIGSWSATLLLDLLSLGRDDEGIQRGADVTLLLGILGASGAVVTGVADWSDLIDTDRRVGFLHGLTNSAILLSNVTSYVLRVTGRRKAGIAWSTAGYLASIFSAYLGGDLVFSKGVGVNHVAFEGGSDDFVAVMDAADLQEGKLTRVDASGIPVVLLRQGSKVYAIGATCPHQGGPLDEGTYQDGTVTCPWHGSCFRMEDGSVVNGPAVYPAPTFDIRVRDGKIELRRKDHA
jgi:nitrite reductase/ring-hydroxylating ferredoxin subunit/uncharacterized membrane protein